MFGMLNKVKMSSLLIPGHTLKLHLALLPGPGPAPFLLFFGWNM